MSERFRIGSTVQRREVLHDRVWLSVPVQVVADDDVLAVVMVDGAPFGFPAHPFGPHPWSAHTGWTGPSLLQLHRPDDAYAVWGFFDGDRLDHWYINFQRRYERGPGVFDTLDHGLDIVIGADGWQWKDREDVADHVASGRLDAAQGAAVWETAEQVAADLDRGDQWWSARWQDWRPDSGR
jgi:hypothetical protein